MSNDTITLIGAFVGSACGLTGTVLGIINTFHQLSRNKVRLKVAPHIVIPVGAFKDAPWNFGIEVVNLSEFAVVITDTGFKLKDGRRGTLATVDGFEKNGKLPLRLEPRTAYSKFFHAEEDTFVWRSVCCAYATTQCGTIATGKSGALDQLIRGGLPR